MNTTTDAQSSAQLVLFLNQLRYLNLSSQVLLTDHDTFLYTLIYMYDAHKLRLSIETTLTMSL